MNLPLRCLSIVLEKRKMNKIEVNQLKNTGIKDDHLVQVAEDILGNLGCDDMLISLAVVGDAEVKRINAKYRNRDEVTDVLSFPAEDQSRDGRRFLGEIILAYPYIEKQAEAGGRDLGDEVAFLVRHGILHLLGYDHRQMKALNLGAI